MDRRDVFAIIKPSGIPAIYGWWEPGNEPERPYAVLHYLYNEDMGADNGVWLPKQRWQLDLVSDRKSEAAEKAIETALHDGGLLFSKTEDIQDEVTKDPYCIVHYRFTTIGD